MARLPCYITRLRKATKLVDPQLDTNFLIKLLQGQPEFVAYAQANKAAGLSYNFATRAEFLKEGTRARLRLLEHSYDIKLIRDVPLPQIEATAQRLQAAFSGDPLRRTLSAADASVLATAFLKGEWFATNDLQVFKRALDLGIQAEFVGTGRAATLATVYRAVRVIIR